LNEKREVQLKSQTLQSKMPTGCGHFRVVRVRSFAEKIYQLITCNRIKFLKLNEIKHLQAYAWDTLVKAFMTAGFS